MHIPQPDTVKQARRVGVGARVSVWWPEPFEQWFEAEVLEVDDEVEPDPDKPEDQDAINPDAFYCLLAYPAQHGFDAEQVDSEWNEVFNSEDAVILDLPPGGREAFPTFVPPGLDATHRNGRPRVVSPLKRQAAAAAATAVVAGLNRYLANGTRKGGQEPAGQRATKARKCSKHSGNANGTGSSRKRAAEDASEEEPARLRGRLLKNAALAQHYQLGAAPPPSQQQQQQQPSVIQQTSRRRAQGIQQRSQQGSQGGSGGAGAEGDSQWHPMANGGGADGDDDFREQQPSQRPVLRLPRPPPRALPDHSRVPDPEGAPAAGVVKRVELQNFMCHSHLAMDFCPNVNLLTGDNGSGKSAVLQALQCCLGARATETGRYRAMKEFVQRGEGQAVIKVTLWNTGPDAYKRSLLGPQLTVVRKINATTGGGYEIQDHLGRTVLRGTKEVQELIEELSIDASNPAIVLTQDMARSFAGERSEANKYKGFMQATHFERTLEHLLVANENVSKMEEHLEQNGASLEALQQEVAGKEALLGQMREMKAWQAHHDKLLKCLAWAPVEALEKGVASLREALNITYPAQHQAHAAQAASYQQQLTGLEAALDEQQRQLDEARRAAEGREQEVAQLREEIKGRREVVRGWQRQLRERGAELEQLQAEQRALEEASREVAEDFVRSTQEAVASHRQRVAHCREQCERAGVAASSARQYRAEREAALAQARDAVLGAERSLVDGKQLKQRLESDLRRLQASQKTPLSKFGGPDTVRLHAAVQAAVQQGRFRQPPILIGSQLSLTDERWGAAVEAAIGRQLSTWIVDNHTDAELLKSLRSQVQQQEQKFSMIVMSYAYPLHNIPPNLLAPEDVVTCLRVLRFQEGPHAHVVKNVLIDHAAIERTVLTNTQREAKECARDAFFWQQYRIANVYAKDGSRAYRRGSTEVSLPPDPRNQRPRLVRDLSQQLAECRAELVEAQAAVAAQQQAVQAKRTEAAEAQRNLQNAEQAHKTAQVHKQTLDTQYQQALSQQPLELDAAAGEAAQRLAQLSNQIADAEVAVDAAEDSLKAAQQDCERLQQRMQDARAVPQQVAEQLAACRDAITELAAEKEAVAGELAAAQELAASTQHKLAVVRRKLTEAEAAFDETLRDAERICRREEAAQVQAQLIAEWQAEGQSEDAIRGLLEQQAMQRRLEQLERKILKREGDAQATYDALEFDLADVKNKLFKRRLQHDDGIMAHQECKAGWQMRRKKFKEMRASVSANLSKSFQRYLGYRQHRGSIDVDYKRERLIFRVGIGGAEPTDDMKALSGGERSLASLAFILALGHVGVNPPFHALDEFDVFMDAINRRLALAFLLEFAWRNPDRQILLLTPQDVSVLEEAKSHVAKQVGRPLPPEFIKIQRMRAPRGNNNQQQQQA